MLPPPFPFVGIAALVLLYLVISYLVSQDDDDRTEDESSSSMRASKEENYSGLSIEEIQQLPWFYCCVNTTTICAVCLDGFQVGERCRTIPVCRHIFHAHCIDLWL